MHFTNVLLTLPVLLNTASAVGIVAYWDTFWCGTENSWYWEGVPEHTCWNWAKPAASVKFMGIPSGAKGQIYYDGCYSYAGEVGEGETCIRNYPYSANWFYPGNLVRRGAEEEEEQRTGVQYVDEDGEVKRIKVELQDFDFVAGLVDNKDWKALAEYPEDVVPTTSPA